MKPLLLRLLALPSIAALATAAGRQADLQTFARVTDTSYEISVNVDGATGTSAWIYARPASETRFDIHKAYALGLVDLDAQGHGSRIFTLPVRNNLPPGFTVELRALYQDNGVSVLSRGDTLSLTSALRCQLLDFDYTIGPNEPQKGQVMTDQWDLAGLRILADSNNGASPDLAIIFDSDNPSGGDFDLATPGPGIGNDAPLGKLLILAENAGDANHDGYIDDPDDDAGGGTISFQFTNEPVIVCSITLVDIDDANPTELRFHKEGGGTSVIQVPALGDNSVQRLIFDERFVVQMDVVLGGSGGIGMIEFVPCPIVLTLEETPLGIPLGFQAGLQITDQFQSLGLTVSAANAVSGHPDKAILFDSGNPTGGDGDLVTPGYGQNNDIALGMILIIAEDDVDLNNDGLVDDPDDEAGGGRIVFDFEENVTFFGATVLDVDGTEVDRFTLFDANNVQIGLLDLGPLGDNSVQRVDANPPVPGVRRVILTLGGSGAVTRLRWCPDAEE